jgi:hypothetical protein
MNGPMGSAGMQQQGGDVQDQQAMAAVKAVSLIFYWVTRYCYGDGGMEDGATWGRGCVDWRRGGSGNRLRGG